MAWFSTQSDIVTVDPNGLLTAVNPGGPVLIFAQAGDVQRGFRVTVTSGTLSSISLSDIYTGTIAVGTTDSLLASGIYSDGSTQDLTTVVAWSSADANTVTVDATGVARGVAAGGPVTVTATFGSVTQTIAITVTSATLQTLSVTDDEGGTVALGTGRPT